MKAAITTDDRRTETVELETPLPGEGQFTIHVDASGICGSDLHSLESLGSGQILGHEFVGTITKLGPGVQDFAVGDRIVALPVIGCKHCRFCLSGDPINCAEACYIGGNIPGSFADHLVVDAQASVAVPDDVSTDLAGVVEPLSIALKVFEKASAKPGDRVLIMGGGPIGLGVLTWAKAGGVGTIIVSDPVASRRELALRMGATHVVDPLAEHLTSYFEREFGEGPQVVIECAGRPGTFADAAEVATKEGRIVIAGMNMKTEEFARLTPFLKNLTVVFCCWYTRRHYAHTVLMMSNGSINPAPMITHRIALEEVNDVLEALKVPNDFGKVLILNDQ